MSDRRAGGGRGEGGNPGAGAGGDCAGQPMGSATACDPMGLSLRSDARPLAKVSDVGLAVGGSALVAGVAERRPELIVVLAGGMSDHLPAFGDVGRRPGEVVLVTTWLQAQVDGACYRGNSALQCLDDTSVFTRTSSRPLKLVFGGSGTQSLVEQNLVERIEAR
jgi:hypothetical protein